MKIWTYQEQSNKVLTDLDLQDETFINPVELVGYFNEAVDEAESELNTLSINHSYDYFLTSKPVGLVTNQDMFPLPPNIYADKIRKIIYQNGSIIYPVALFKPRYEFEDIAFSQFYGKPDDYRFILVNDQPGQMRMKLVPVSRETAILPPPLPYPDSANPIPNLFVPMLMWYMRTAQRLPLPTFNNVQGELLPRESLVQASINVGANTISTVCGFLRTDGVTQYVAGGVPYITGDILYLSSTGTLPSPLQANTPYYVIALGGGNIRLASSLANAQAGVPIVVTDQGAGYHQISVVTTPTILASLLVDIPQFATFVMQWVKCRCLEKEGDPRLQGATIILQQQREQMVSTLSNRIPDLDDEIEPDLSHYQEMS